LLNEMNKREAKTLTIGVRVTPEFHELLKKYADREHRTIANFMRSAAKRYIEKMENGVEKSDEL